MEVDFGQMMSCSLSSCSSTELECCVSWIIACKEVSKLPLLVMWITFELSARNGCETTSGVEARLGSQSETHCWMIREYLDRKSKLFGLHWGKKQEESVDAPGVWIKSRMRFRDAWTSPEEAWLVSHCGNRALLTQSGEMPVLRQSTLLLSELIPWPEAALTSRWSGNSLRLPSAGIEKVRTACVQW